VKYAQGSRNMPSTPLFRSVGRASGNRGGSDCDTGGTKPEEQVLDRGRLSGSGQCGAVCGSRPDRAAAFAKKALTAPKGAKPDNRLPPHTGLSALWQLTRKNTVRPIRNLRARCLDQRSVRLEGPAYFFLGEANYTLGRQGMDRLQTDRVLNSCCSLR